MRNLVVTLLILCLAGTVKAQDIFGPSNDVKTRHGFILNGNVSFDLPAADMAKRFGKSYRLGPAVTYKTESNWVFGVKFDFILGNKITDDSFMINIRDKYNASFNGKLVELIDVNGNRSGVPIYERGYETGVQVGKIFNFKKSQPDNGLFLLTTIGFVQHKIDIYNADKSIPGIQGAYLKGYDRLTNGWCIDQYAGYAFFSKNELLNFSLGLDVMVGFTQGRRDYLFDVMRPDNQKRTDILYGIRGGWMIPVFKRKVEEVEFQ